MSLWPLCYKNLLEDFFPLLYGFFNEKLAISLQQYI